MKKSVLVLSLASILVAGGGALAAEQAAPPRKQTVCPVMGGPVNPKVFVDYKGQRVYFCCGGCPAEFNKDPAKYIAKLEKAGVTLDKTPAANAAQPPAAAHAAGHGCCN